MKIGYVRVKTQKDSTENQVSQLKNAGCEKLFFDYTHAKDFDRPALNELIDYASEGDVIVCTITERIACTTSAGIRIFEALESKGCQLNIIHLNNMDIISTTGKIMFVIQCAALEFEFQRAIENTNDGRQAAMDAGIKFGPKVTERTKKAESLVEQGLKCKEVMTQTGISKAGYYRIKNKLAA